jgi:uncharacterized protein (TIGR02646 family)
MRPVVITGIPSQEWLDEAERLTQLLRDATSKEEREEIIEGNQSHWINAAFRDWLIEQFHQKCWYSESRESVSSYHVDHFRPKGRIKKLDGTFEEGYWWLAFRWENYRISGQLVNIRKSDRFPLARSYKAVSCNDNSEDDECLQYESPYLLDPCKDDEAWLISFRENGEAAYAGTDEDEKHRVDFTIDILDLNGKSKQNRLVNNRHLVWTKCALTIEDHKSLSGFKPLDKVKKIMLVKKLKEMIQNEEEFSSVAIACLQKTAPEPLCKQVMN